MTTFEIPLGNAPRAGQALHLVKWEHTADGWESQTLLVTYVYSTADRWEVELDGQRVTLSRTEWLLFQP